MRVTTEQLAEIMQVHTEYRSTHDTDHSIDLSEDVSFGVKAAFRVSPQGSESWAEEVSFTVSPSGFKANEIRRGL